MNAQPGLTTRPARLALVVAGGLSLISWLAYLATLTPSLSFVSQDGNELAIIPAILGLAHAAWISAVCVAGGTVHPDS